MDDPPKTEWDIPKDILGEIFTHFRAKILARCSCVAKSWSEVVEEDRFIRKVRLESAWRCEKLAPKRIAFEGLVLNVSGAMEGDIIAMGHLDGVVLLDARNENLIARENTGWKIVDSFVDGLLLTIHQYRLSISVWEIPILHEKKSFSVSFPVQAIVDCGKFVAIGGSDGHLGLWGKEEWTCQKVLYEGDAKNDIVSLAANEGKSSLFSGFSCGDIHVWSLESFDRVRVIECYEKNVYVLHVHGNLIMSRALDWGINLWSQETGKCVKSFPKECSRDYYISRAVSQGYYIPRAVFNGDKFIRKTPEGHVALWDVSEDRCLRTFHAATWDVAALFLTDHRLTVVSANGEVLLWDFSVDLV